MDYEFYEKCSSVFIFGYEINLVTRSKTYIVSQKEINSCIILFLEIRSQTKVEDEDETSAGDENDGDSASELSLTLKWNMYLGGAALLEMGEVSAAQDTGDNLEEVLTTDC